MTRDNFTENRIKSLLNSVGKVLVFDELDSTNTYLKLLAADGAKGGTLVIAKSQTKGRGRLGRSFVSDNGGLYMSLLLRPDLPTVNSLLITVAAAVSVAEGIKNICGRECGIKWVNDIFLNGKKISGILTEGAVNPKNGFLDYAVLGIGINIKTPKNGFPDEIKDIAGAIFEADEKNEYLPELAAEIINIFMKYYQNLDNKEYMSEYKRRSILTGKRVSFIKDGKTQTATVLGIDDDARLILDRNGEIITLQAGEVSVRY